MPEFIKNIFNSLRRICMTNPRRSSVNGCIRLKSEQLSLSCTLKYVTNDRGGVWVCYCLIRDDLEGEKPFHFVSRLIKQVLSFLYMFICADILCLHKQTYYNQT